MTHDRCQRYRAHHVAERGRFVAHVNLCPLIRAEPFLPHRMRMDAIAIGIGDDELHTCLLESGDSTDLANHSPRTEQGIPAEHVTDSSPRANIW